MTHTYATPQAQALVKAMKKIQQTVKMTEEAVMLPSRINRSCARAYGYHAHPILYAVRRGKEVRLVRGEDIHGGGRI